MANKTTEIVTCRHCGRPIEMKDDQWNHIEGMWAWGHFPFHDPEPDSSIGNCDVCGKPVYWGVDGCPVVAKERAMGALFGWWDSVRHYDCKDSAELQKLIDYNNFCAHKTLNPDK